MKRSNILPKLILLAAVGMLLCSFIPAVAASQGKGRVTIRPIDDWLINNPFGSLDFVSPDSNLVIKMGFPFPGPVLDEVVLVEGETEFGGFILERVLNDGRAEVTVHLFAKNTPMTVFNWDEFAYYVWGGGPRPDAILGSWADGYMDHYKFEMKFILDGPGQEIPFIWALFDYDILISLKIVGTGYGIFTEHAAEFGFTPGAQGKAFINQILLFKPQLNPDHPKMYYPELWPIETVEIHEIGWM